MDAAAPLASEGAGLGAGTAQTQILDFFFPGFSGTLKFRVPLWPLPGMSRQSRDEGNG